MGTDRWHHYPVRITWTGDRGDGTSGYRAYSRDHVIEAAGKPPVEGSSDPAFRGDPARWTPEDMFVAALSSCHMLWYLHLCADAGIVVHGYVDDASGEMVENAEDGGRFVRVELRPRVMLAPAADSARALALHEAAHRRCFIANSVCCEVTVRPVLEPYQGS